jgi:hypothetical protein
MLRVAISAILLCIASDVAALPCPRTGAQQERWVTQTVNVLVRSAQAAFEDDRADSRYERVVGRIDRELTRCKLADDRDFAGGYPEFLEYVKLLSLALKEENQLGFNVTDKVYFAETSNHTSIPEFLLSPRFLKSVSGSETLPQAKALLREINAARAPEDRLLFFSYDSRHLGTPDNPDSYRRLLIVVAGNAALRLPEKWVQFGIADRRKPASVRNVSVVAVMPGANGTSQVYFKDFYRTYRRDGSITLSGRWELGEGDDNCVSCHKSGVLPIFPVKGSVSRDELPLVEAVNERFLSYDPARFDRYLDTTKFGPSLGSARSGESAADKFKPPACTSCHHSNDMGPLNWPMDSTIIRSFIEGGKMPLGATMGRGERSRLYRSLVTDYFAIDAARPGILKAWLLRNSRQQTSSNR